MIPHKRLQLIYNEIRSHFWKSFQTEKLYQWNPMNQKYKSVLSFLVLTVKLLIPSDKSSKFHIDASASEHWWYRSKVSATGNNQHLKRSIFFSNFSFGCEMLSEFAFQSLLELWIAMVWNFLLLFISMKLYLLQLTYINFDIFQIIVIDHFY